MANLTSSFSSVNAEMPLENIHQSVRDGRLQVLEPKELVDLNDKANEALYCASKQKMKADTSQEMVPFLNLNCHKSVMAILNNTSVPRRERSKWRRNATRGLRIFVR
ncbi:hypothetical protein D8674_000192 [Pyrus ussuriensis x Pyrus communis]|uniref:Uncharacterized protein n=1 Tax=Pyrus ussuriensis x Pyrus communis TaxID=2448454 RepID=A0A5N5F7W5_9ROSA|nr:hypothetical protein D8674_000192 [Pyrus ussuriensis x Pyrus communis]